MFGDMFGDMEARQKEMREKLAEFILEAEAGDGAVKVSANANREITNLSIDKEKLDWEDSEAVEDLVMVAINRALEKAAAKEMEESQRLMQDMLLPGLSGLFGG